MIPRILEPEVMDTPEEALAYDGMDFSAVNSDFAQAAIALGCTKGRVLDVGTGTARIPIEICKQLPGVNIHITAIDLAESMLTIGRKNVIQAGLTEKISLERVDAKQMPYPDQSFDIVISNSIVHHLPDPYPFFQEVQRVLKPGGGILLRDLLRPATLQDLETIVATVGESYDRHQSTLFYNSLHAAFTMTEMAALLGRLEWRDVRLYASSERHWTIDRLVTPTSGTQQGGVNCYTE